MEQITQEQNFKTRDNKAIIGLILGVVGLLSWISGPISNRIIDNNHPFIISIFAFSALSLIGIIFAVIGFKSRKVVSIVAIILCILGIFPSLVMSNLMSSLNMSFNNVVPNKYKTVDFSIEIPDGWVKLDSNSKTKETGIRVAFTPKQTTDSFKPRISVTSLQIEEANDFNVFVQGEEQAIKNEYFFISGKTLNLLNKPSYYEINYTYDYKGDTIRGREFLTVKNGVGYIITTESLESSYQKYLPEFTKKFISFKLF